MSKQSSTWPEGHYSVIRTYSAGVHVGIVTVCAGTEVVLSQARRIWTWKGANTLHEIALRGVGAGSRVSEEVDGVLLTGVIEIIPCTGEAERNLRAGRWL